MSSQEILQIDGRHDLLWLLDKTEPLHLKSRVSPSSRYKRDLETMLSGTFMAGPGTKATQAEPFYSRILTRVTFGSGIQLDHQALFLESRSVKVLRALACSETIARAMLKDRRPNLGFLGAWLREATRNEEKEYHQPL